jgi:hypothetical protein
MIVNHVPKRIDPQRVLFDARGVGTLGACRYYVGDYFEQRTATYYAGIQLATTGTKGSYCPDVWSSRESSYFESKAVGRNGNVILYDMRLDKDKEFATANSLCYVIWRHSLRLKLWHEHNDALACLHEELEAHLLSHIRVPFAALYEYVTPLPKRTVNSGYTKQGKRLGYGQKGYGVGWTIPYNKLRELATESVEYAKV